MDDRNAIADELRSLHVRMKALDAAKDVLRMESMALWTKQQALPDPAPGRVIRVDVRMHDTRPKVYLSRCLGQFDFCFTLPDANAVGEFFKTFDFTNLDLNDGKLMDAINAFENRGAVAQSPLADSGGGES